MAARSGMLGVLAFFGVKAAEWKKLSEQDKTEMKNSIGTYDGDTKTYTGTGTY